MSQSDTQVFRERAIRDKSAIIELRQNPAFNDYFMRRVKEKIADGTLKMKTDDTIEKREAARQSVLFYEEIVRWFSDSELASCDRTAAQ